MTASHTNIVSSERYRREMTKAQLSDLLRRISGEDTDLLQFDEVARRLRSRQRVEKGTQMVPLDKIVGSVGRYKDFTREFLPRSGANKSRWMRIDAAMNALQGLPPVELFKLGDAYFVRDGNHRVSVARANDVSHIEAYVTEYATPVPLEASDFERDQWLIKIERAEFLAETKLDQLRPEHNLEISEPGRYEILLRHIQVHQYLRSQDMERSGERRALTWNEAVQSWYDTVYMPMVEAIRRYGVLEHFPDRTEADLYLWIVHHREELAQRYGLAPLSPDTAVTTFNEVYSGRPLESAVKGLRLGLQRAFGLDERPLGMSDDEYELSRARHDAGEISLAEAEERAHAEATEQEPQGDVESDDADDQM